MRSLGSIASRCSMWPARAPANGRAVTSLPSETLQTWLGVGAPTLSFVVPAHNEEHELPASLSAHPRGRRRFRGKL